MKKTTYEWKKRSFSFQAMPRPSLFASVNIGSISVFNLAQSADQVMHLAAYIETPQNTKNWILIVENFPHVVFVHTDKIN